jgi:urea transport system ATP-binding protein
VLTPGSAISRGGSFCCRSRVVRLLSSQSTVRSTPKHHRDHRPAPVQRPGNGRAVAAGEPDQEALHDAVEARRLLDVAQQPAAHHRCQRQRDEAGGRHGTRQREREFAEQPPGAARREGQRREYRGQRQRHRDDGEADLADALERRLEGLHALIAVAVGVLQHDDRVDDDDDDDDQADRQPRSLKRVFDIDMPHCPNSGRGEPKIIAAILERPVIEKILTHLGLDLRPPPRAPAREPGRHQAGSSVSAVRVHAARNGVGKSTLLRCLLGLVPIRSGRIGFEGRDIAARPPYERVRLGIGYMPQGREIFNRLTVEENLRMGLATRPAGTAIPAELFELFPVLKQMLNRRGGDLSGGQQQQLAIARALAPRPKVLILDEPTEGIQPSIIKDIGRVLRRLADRGMAGAGGAVGNQRLAIVLVEQYYDFAAELADRYLVMERGEVVMRGRGKDMEAEGARQRIAI